MGWILAEINERAAQDISRRLQLPRVLGRVLAQMGAHSAEDAQRWLHARGDLDWMASFKPSPQIIKAVQRLREAQAADERVVIYGDYDADGVSGASILQRYFKVGMQLDSHVFLPSRFKEGYGLNASVIPELAAAGTTLIVTTDNGITAVEAARACRAHGVDLIVTDHHSAKGDLPDALALVHPKVDFPQYAALSGAGVALMLCVVLSDHDLRRAGQLLDLACIGTLGDMVPLTDYNRALVHLGLKRWNLNHKRVGAQALLDAHNAANPKYPVRHVTAQDLGFVIAPMVNAAGRLEHPALAYELLVTDDRQFAEQRAAHLVQLNATRKDVTKALYEEVRGRIEREMPPERYPFIVLDGVGWHHGLVGLVAGKVLQDFGRPVVLLGQEEDEPGLYRGSARAPKGVDLVGVLSHADALMTRWGGHAQAAGCGVEKHHLEAFRDCLNGALNQTGWRVGAALPIVAAAVTVDEIDSALMDALELLEPHGQENPRPLLALENVTIDAVRVQKGHLFGKVRHDLELVGWFKGPLAPLPERVDVLFHLERATDFFSGATVLRLRAEHILPAHARHLAASPSFGGG
jgi:single-stranded-DNA-specific exonuclease